MKGRDRRKEAGEFLRSRRERVRPADVGVVVTGVRRVPGLRRDELARLAGVSVEYYVRLEQGRAGIPSEGVVAALAGALGLDDGESAHLRDLCHPAPRTRSTTPPAERVRPTVQRLLDAVAVPALVFGRRTEVLAWNDGAAALLTDFGARDPHDRNIARLVFLDDGFGALMADWETVALETVGVLRLAAGRYPDDPALAALVGELTVKSPDFSRWWNAREVRRKAGGPKRIDHPQLGLLDLVFEALTLPSDPDQTLVTYFAAEPGSPSDTALALLGATARPVTRG